jgi:hypothetical protein
MSKRAYTPRIGQGPAGIGKGFKEVEPQKLSVRDVMRKHWDYLPRAMRGTGVLTLKKVEDGGQTTFFGNDAFLSR